MRSFEQEFRAGLFPLGGDTKDKLFLGDHVARVVGFGQLVTFPFGVALLLSIDLGILNDSGDE